MEIDDQDRILVTEYRGNKVAMFDTKTEQFTEYPLPTPYSGPYRAQIDKNGEIWADGMHTDRVIAARSEDRPDGGISAAVRHQYALAVARRERPRR